MKEGMLAFSATHRKLEAVTTWREQNPFGTPLWNIEGHTLASEQGKPAIQWTSETLYEGDDEAAARDLLWEYITNPYREEPYVLFVYRAGDLLKRIDIC